MHYFPVNKVPIHYSELMNLLTGEDNTQCLGVCTN